jgi:hypothetical protein
MNAANLLNLGESRFQDVGIAVDAKEVPIPSESADLPGTAYKWEELP